MAGHKGFSGKDKAEEIGWARTYVLAMLAGVVAVTGGIFTGLSYRLNRAGQITDRFTRAIDQLGDRDALDVRLGGIYALERIARDSKHDHPQVMEVLTSFVRRRRPLALDSRPEEYPLPRSNPDVQAALTVIGRRNRSFDVRPIDLSGTDLRTARLSEAHLEGTNLFAADLRGAILEGTHLEGATLSAGKLDGAKLKGAHLEDVDLTFADLNYATLDGATFNKGSSLYAACFRHATFEGAHLEGVDLGGTRLRGARLQGSHLKGASFVLARLGGADLTGVDLREEQLNGAFLEGANCHRGSTRKASKLLAG
jgi:uncharacterized protein YjbI with pentapeptide repeats